MRFTRFARGRKSVRGQMNKTEERYASHLEQRKLAGEIEWYAYEPWRLRIADGENAFYAPDFGVMLSDGTVECHETKAGTIDKKTGQLKTMSEEAARVRIKVAASTHPFRFVLAVERPRKAGGGFEVSEV